MTGVALGLLWGGLVLLVAWHRRPPPLRVQLLVASPGGPRSRPQPPPRATAAGRRLLVIVGGGARRVARRAPDAAADRRVGRAIVSGLPALAVLPAAAPLVVAAVWAWPAVAGQRAERRRLQQAAAAMAEVVDLFALAVAAGLTVPLAVTAVARRVEGPVGDGLRDVVDQVALGRRTADALDDLADRLEPVRPLTSALAASERYGVVLGPGLQRLAAEVRTDRRRRAEEAARRIPVKLLFPLVLCTLPAFALLTVAPLIAGALESLRL